MRPVPRALLLAALAACGTDVEPAAPAAGRNLLLITVAGLRHDVLEEFCRAHPGGALAELRRRADVHTECRTPVPSTLGAHCSLFTGADPWRHGVHLDELFRLDPGWSTLAELLAEAGFATAACLSTSLLEECHGVLQGFARIDRPLIETLGLVPLGPHRALPQRWRGSAETLAAAEELLAPLRTPFFLWVELGIAPLRRPDALERPARELALAELEAVEAGLAELLGTLARGDRGEWTVVALAGVHGECYEADGGKDHRRSVSDAAVHVPLWIAAPGVPAGRELSRPISLTSARALVAQRLGLVLDDPVAALLCESVAGWIEADRPVQYALVREGWKWVFDGAWSRVELPVPADEEGARQGVAPRESRHVTELLAQSLGTPALAERLATSDSLEERLRALVRVPAVPEPAARAGLPAEPGVPHDGERWLAVDPVAFGAVSWRLPAAAVQEAPVPDRRVQELVLFQWFSDPEEHRAGLSAMQAQEWIDRLADELPYRAWVATVAADPAACPERPARRRQILAERALAASPFYLPAARILATVLASGSRAEDAARLLQEFGRVAPLGAAAREEFQERLTRTHVPALPAPGDSR